MPRREERQILGYGFTVTIISLLTQLISITSADKPRGFC